MRAFHREPAPKANGKSVAAYHKRILQDLASEAGEAEKKARPPGEDGRDNNKVWETISKVDFTTADHAAEYCNRGFALVVIPPGEKGPKRHGWNQPGGYITDPEQARRHWQRRSQDNLGVVLETSGLCSLDVDSMEAARLVMAELGFDLDGWRDNYPTVQGNPARFRCLFKVPAGAALARHALTWPGQNGDKPVTVFELRAGLVQDVLPPSIHPDTGKPYTWLTPLPAGDLPELPAELLDLWQNWEQHKNSLADLCPWAARRELPALPKRPAQGDSVIAAFNAAHDLAAILEQQGYRRKGNRYLAPSSSSQVPGVTLLNEQFCFSHHASDPLNDGAAHDAFDVFRLLEHGGDFRAATKAAAQLLGMEHGKPAIRDKGKAKATVATSVQAENHPAPEGQRLSVFKTTEQGIFWCGTDKEKPQKICSRLDITALTRNGNGNAWGRLLEFKDKEGRAHTWAMPMRLLSGDGQEYRAALLDMGLEIVSDKKARDLLTNYIQSATPGAWALCVERTGWHGDAYILPDEQIGPPTADRVLLQTEHGGAAAAYAQAGTLEEWRHGLAALCVGNTRLVFAVSCAFASMLLELNNAESGGFHFRGGSSIGKTIAQRAACSVFGGVEHLQPWRATVNGLEAIAATHNDALLILDELGQIDAKEAGAAAYTLASGQGKQRANRHGAARPLQRWRLLFLSSGELSLADKMNEASQRARAGQETRLADIPADTGRHGAFENLHDHDNGAAFADAVKRAALAAYGIAARAFLRRLVAEPDPVKARFSALVDTFLIEHLPAGADGQVSRVARRFALVAAGGELATGLGITGWPEKEAGNAAAVCFQAWLGARGGIGNLEEQRALEQVRLFFQLHGESRFTLWDDTSSKTTINRAGYRRPLVEGGVEFYVFPEVFKAEICKGLDARFVAKLLVSRGLLYAEKEGKPQTKPRLPGIGPKRVYHFAPAILGE